MKTSTIFALFVAAVSATQLSKRACSAQCVEKVFQAGGCEANDFACSCSKAGTVRQLQPCLEFACETTAYESAKVSFAQKCQAAGIQIWWGEDHVTHHEMARRDTVAKASGAAKPRASATTTRGAKPAMYTGGAAPRDIAGSMLGLVAAVAAAAAI